MNTILSIARHMDLLLQGKYVCKWIINYVIIVLTPHHGKHTHTGMCTAISVDTRTNIHLILPHNIILTVIPIPQLYTTIYCT